jgi:hypothetical protein
MTFFRGKLVEVPKNWTLLYDRGRLVQIMIGRKIIQLPKRNQK